MRVRVSHYRIVWGKNQFPHLTFKRAVSEESAAGAEGVRKNYTKQGLSFKDALCGAGKLASGLAMVFRLQILCSILGLSFRFSVSILLPRLPSALLGAVQHVELNLV